MLSLLSAWTVMPIRDLLWPSEYKIIYTRMVEWATVLLVTGLVLLPTHLFGPEENTTWRVALHQVHAFLVIRVKDPRPRLCRSLGLPPLTRARHLITALV